MSNSVLNYNKLFLHVKNLKKVLLVATGRTGSDFFQSLLDSHPQILHFTGIWIFHDWWKVAKCKNNVLLLEIDNKGLLAKKDYYTIKDMNKVKFLDDTTEIAYSKKSFVYDFLSSMRQKINDPLGVREKQRNKKRRALD